MARLAGRAGLSPAGVYWGLAMGSGLIAGAVFALAFTWIAAVTPTAAELTAASALLLGYVCYATAGRYRADVSTRLVAWLVILALANALGVLGALVFDFRALGIALVQVSSMLLAAWLMALRRH